MKAADRRALDDALAAINATWAGRPNAQAADGNRPAATPTPTIGDAVQDTGRD